MVDIKLHMIVIAAVIAVMAPQHATPANNRDAELLHKAHCTACHTTSIYTRKKRRVTNYQQLLQQVNGCNHMLSKNFNERQVNALVKYLNSNYYKFK